MPKLPESKVKKSSLTVKIENTLLELVKSECSKRHITLTQAVEYGLRVYIDQVTARNNTLDNT